MIQSQNIDAPLQVQSNASSGIIPYKNGPALIGYYCAVFSLIPVVGLVLAIPALLLGIAGLMKKRKHPEVKGSAHAWIGILLGGLMTLLWGGGIVWFFVSLSQL